MALVAVMMVTAFPRLTGFLSVADKDRATRWVIAQNSRLTTQAVSRQQRHVLRVDVGGNRLSTVIPAADADNIDVDSVDAVEAVPDVRPGDTFIPDGNLIITGVAFSDHQIIHSGTVDIVYYEQGYSDQAIIYMTAGDKRLSFHIAPFLSRVRVYDGHVAFRQLGRRP